MSLMFLCVFLDKCLSGIKQPASLVQFCGYQLLGILEVIDGIELTREEVGDVEHAVGMSLGDESLEGQLVVAIFQVLHQHHLLQFGIEGAGVFAAHAFNT